MKKSKNLINFQHMDSIKKQLFFISQTDKQINVESIQKN